MEHRDERIIVETERHRISGLVRLPVDGYRSRLTDYLNASEREFLALTDVEVTSLNGSQRVEQRDFVALSLHHIVLAMPAAEGSEPEDLGASAHAGLGPNRESSAHAGLGPNRESSGQAGLGLDRESSGQTGPGPNRESSALS